MFKSNICPLLSFFTYPIGYCGFKGFNNVISPAKIAILFDSAKGLTEKSGSETGKGCKAARLQAANGIGDLKGREAEADRRWKESSK